MMDLKKKYLMSWYYIILRFENYLFVMIYKIKVNFIIYW